MFADLSREVLETLRMSSEIVSSNEYKNARTVARKLIKIKIAKVQNVFFEVQNAFTDKTL